MENNMEHGAEEMKGKTCSCGAGGKCGCGHHKVIPILIIILGLAFLLAQVNVLTWAFVGVTWPILIIIAGCVKLMGSSCKCCGKK
jgi:hypothetical protein